MGSAQRLANGNTLLCESVFGRVFEVTLEGYVCWEYVSPHFAPYSDEVTAKIFAGDSNLRCLGLIGIRLGGFRG
jgi:hypothetical protein